MILLSDGNPLASLISFRFKPQRGKFTHYGCLNRTQRELVSNPNGVNLHALGVLHIEKQEKRFKPQRGKFTHPLGLSLVRYALFQTPTG